MNRDHLRDCWRRHSPDAAMLGLIVAFFLLFFAWVWGSGRFVIGGDAFLYSYPLRTVAWTMIRHGELPLWTPLVLSGYPLLAMTQVAPAYPLTWGYLVLPGYVAEQIYVLAPFLLAPAFTYAYAREIGCSRMGALLAGLAFGYGGAAINLLGVIGMPTNAQMWLPLFLIAIERSRTRSFAACLLGGASAYLMSLLTGYAQSFVVVGLVAIAYALFLVCLPDGGGSLPFNDAPRELDEKHAGIWERMKLRRWRPLLIALGAIAAGGGVAAFQILETLRAARRSVRSALSYEAFGEGSFTLTGAGRALIAPLYTERFADVTTYVPPLVLLLAGVTLVLALRRKLQGHDRRIWFWIGVAVISWLLMLGTNTPFYKLIYQIPILNRFRVPSRHAFEWVFALSILTAYGWDALSKRISPSQTPAANETRQRLFAVCLCLVAAIAAWFWWRASGAPPAGTVPYDPHRSWYAGPLALKSYLVWKVLFTILSLAAFWFSLKVVPLWWRDVLLATVVALVCFVEPYIMARHWWARYLKEPTRLTQPAATTRWLLGHDAPTTGRVYTRVQTAVVFAEEQSNNPRIDGPNLTAIYGLQNVAGYEPLILERYSRALGNVFLDSVTPRRGFVSDLSLFAPRSHVLDLLNTAYVASYAHLDLTPQTPLMRSNIEFAAADLGDEINPGATVTLDCPPTSANTIALVTSLSHSTGIDDNTRVARIKILTADNHAIEVELHAGADTAEWAHERPDVRATIKHRLAPIFDSRPGNAADSFSANRYWTRIPLGAPANIVKIEITNLTSAQPLALWKASLYDSLTGSSHPLLHFDWSRWQTVYDEDGALILRNTRALPRAWLVAEAEAVDGEEALRRIQGEGKPFDPHRVALLEVFPNELPQLPGGEVSPDSTARIVTYEPNRLQIETNAPTSTVLVLSEMFYPGWKATVDGQPAQILLTDYLLRGVALPAGAHKVEMHYSAPAARNGAIISGLTLTLLLALSVYAARRKT